MESRGGRARLRRAWRADERVAKMFATEKPATLLWCMGQTQHTVGTANVRASCIALLMTGNVGAARNRRQHLPRP